MAKRPAASKDSPRLFERHEQAHERRLRRQRALFIPRYVKEAAAGQRLAGPARINAHQIAVRWAELESSGNLAKHKETSIDTQFLDQLFGDGLGYQLKTKRPTDYHLEHKYAVSGIGTADAALGEFPGAKSPNVVIELKGSQTDLDRDRSSGRTAVQQCWDYLNALPGCEWGIVSNFSTIRLYHRSKGSLNYEEFTLQELRDAERFNEFYALFERGGLLTSSLKQPPRALALLQQTEKRQKEVGDDLYESYRYQRLHLIDHLKTVEGKTLDEAIRIAQKLLDRIIFIAFCEDRELLPEKCLERAHGSVQAFSKVTNELLAGGGGRRRKGIPMKVRWEVLLRDGRRCVVCGRGGEGTRLEIDHVVPVCAGGGNEAGNLRTLCERCNRGKGGGRAEV